MQRSNSEGMQKLLGQDKEGTTKVSITEEDKIDMTTRLTRCPLPGEKRLVQYMGIQ
jgi:hypothetical protein